MQSVCAATDSGTDVCPTCRDLNYDLYDKVITVLDDYVKALFPQTSSSLMRSRTVEFDSLIVSGRGGCQYCHLLHQGINFFWKQDNVMWEDEFWDACGLSDYLDGDSEEKEEFKCYITIEIRLNRPLTVVRHFSQEIDYVALVTRLEFYTEPGRCAPPEEFFAAAHDHSRLHFHPPQLRLFGRCAFTARSG